MSTEPAELQPSASRTSFDPGTPPIARTRGLGVRAGSAGGEFSPVRTGRNYWQTWTRVATRFERGLAKTIPEHWCLAGSRTSWVDGKRARKAATPVHAIVNYAYTIAQVEATVAARKLGFDPSLGLMHADQRYRGSLATDLMEPVRPVADALVLDPLYSHELQRGAMSSRTAKASAA